MLNETVIPNRLGTARPVPSTRKSPGRFPYTGLLFTLVILVCGCQELSYTGPHGERFTRRCLGTVTAVGMLTVEADTNGVRRVELRNYQNDANQALGTVTEAAVRAALEAAKL